MTIVAGVFVLVLVVVLGAYGLFVTRPEQQEQRKLWNEREAQSIELIKKAGVEIITFSPQEKKRFQDAVRPVWDKYGTKYADLVKRIQAVS